MRHIRSDSTQAVIKAMVDAGQEPPGVPAHVRIRKGDEPFWDAIILARARDEWTETDLVVAAQLARCQHDIEVESRRGKKHKKPELIDRLVKLQLAMMRALRMGGTPIGNPGAEKFRRLAERQARKALAEVKIDELLAS